MNSHRLRAVLEAVEEGASGPPRLSIREAVQAEFEGYLEAAEGGGWLSTTKGTMWLCEALRRSEGLGWKYLGDAMPSRLGSV